VPGPAPKPPGTSRRDPDAASWTTFDEAASPTDIPAWPGKFDPDPLAKEYWDAIWTSPMGRAFLPVDVMQIARICRLHALDMIGALRVTGQAELRMLEDAFGISPKARRTLRWDIERAAGPGAAAPNQAVDTERKRRQQQRAELSRVK
jgi:hypothetical protein